MPEAKYKRVLLKLSGEALRGESTYGIDGQILDKIALEIKKIVEMGVQVGIVVGGGNIWRGAQAEADSGMDRVTADYAGMLATLINALALQAALEKHEVATRTQSALEIRQVAEPYIRRQAIRHLQRGRVVIFAGGTGNPYMTADTAGALRAIETDAEVLIMTKNGVEGIYTDDPRRNPKAKKIDKISHLEALSMRLKVMDTTALSLCLDNKLPIIVFNPETKDGIVKAVMGKSIGTLVTSEG